MVDLARGCPIAVLEDRLAETVAAWLKAHPDVKIVARDRADAYAAGIRQGAPAAVQVADRFHLLQHLAGALEQVFSTHRQDLETLNAVQSRALVTRDDGAAAIPVPAPLRPPTVQEKAAQHRACRLGSGWRLGCGDRRTRSPRSPRPRKSAAQRVGQCGWYCGVRTSEMGTKRGNWRSYSSNMRSWPRPLR